MTTIRVFFDANVLFAAGYSASGYARDLIRLAIQGRLQMVVSRDVLTEAIRNMTRKAPERVDTYQELLSLIALEITDDPSPEDVRAAEAYVVQKDAIIIAAAINAQPDYFVTYDRRHLIDPPVVAEKSGLTIVTPDVVVKAFEASEG